MRHTPCGRCPFDRAAGAELSPTAYFFLSCQKKVCKKEAQDAKIALTRRKTSRYILRFFRSTFRSPNALRATVKSGFCIARYSVRVVTLAPVEYLTYEIRDISDFV